MLLKEYIDEVFTIDLEDIKDLSIEDIILQFHAKNLKRMYILNENRTVFVLSPKEIVDFFLNYDIKQNIYEVLKDKNPLDCFNAKKHIIDAYCEMRKENLDFIPACENGKFIGEIDFNVLSLKISYIVIKDELTGVYNKKYFDVIVEEYKDINKPIGLILIEIKDLPIFEGLYGVDMVYKIIESYAKILKRSVRDIDFIFRWDNQFRIMVFNNLEVTAKIFERIKNKLDQLKINEIHIPFNICMTHIPEMSNDILIGIEECEEKLIKRD